MSLAHDYLEDSFIPVESDSTQVEEKEPVRKQKCVSFCKCLIYCCPCCRRLASTLLARDLGNALQDIDNKYANNLVSKHPPKVIEKGSLAGLRKIHEKQEVPDPRPTMEQFRVQQNLKKTIPKLKTFKHGKNSSKDLRRHGRLEGTLDVPIDKADLNQEGAGGYLDVMDHGCHYVPAVMRFLITKYEATDLLDRGQKSKFPIRASNITLSQVEVTFQNSKVTSPISTFFRKKNPISTIQSPRSVRSGTSSTSFHKPPISKSVVNYSTLLVKEFEKNWSKTIAYVQTWLTNYRKHRKLFKERRTLDRWKVMIYTSSEPQDDLSEFCCLFIRELLIHYRVAYQEKDIALVDKNDFKKELQQRLDPPGSALVVPCIFVANYQLGGSRVIWALHKMNLFKEVFHGFIMTPEMFDLWKYESVLNFKTELIINVSLNDFPSLEAVSKHVVRARLKNDKMKEVGTGKDIVRKSKEKWKHDSTVSFTDLDLHKFVTCKESIYNAFRLMDFIFWCYLAPNKDYMTTSLKTMKAVIAKAQK